MLSKKAKYALQALTFLAQHADQDSTGIAEIAEQEKIPRKFLETILLELKNQGILISKRGKGGGYALRQDAEAISIGQVIRVIDGPLALTPCASRTAFKPCQECKKPDSCSIRLLMVKVRDATAEILDHTTLRHIIDSQSALLYMI
ncbi:MAG: Rrf2 family transcriptional regulator [Bacteroidota bacterium]